MVVGSNLSIGTKSLTEMNKGMLKRSVYPNLPCILPKACLGLDTNPASVAAQFQDKLESLVPSMFVKDAVWRDILALTGTLRTIYSSTSIASAWMTNCKRRKATRFNLAVESAQAVQVSKDCSWVTVSFTFETESEPSCTCSGYLELVSTEADVWKIWMLRTILDQIKGLPDVDELAPVMNGTATNTDAKCSVSETNGVHNTSHFDCVVIGGGQAGLSMGGRLKSLGVNYLVLDKYKTVGDSWKTRYDSVKLHFTKNCAHLPFERTFPMPYPDLLSKDDLAKGYQSWVQKFGVNIWTSTELTSGTWDCQQRRYTLHLNRHEKEQTISATHIVMAVGGGGQIPVMPSYPDKDKFNGVVLHSAHYRSSTSWKGLKGIVVGTANTAHDVAEDMLEAGLSEVTMIQRNKTFVVPSEHLAQLVTVWYNETLPTKVGDSLYMTLPLGVASLISHKILSALADAEPERFDALQRAGFLTERNAYLDHHIYERSGGHYIDVGCSKKISDGKIKIKSDALACRYFQDGLEFEDGSRLEADVIVFATGFLGNVQKIVESLFGADVASRADDYWGLDPEGELNGAFKPQKQPGLWYIGGTLNHARYFSRHIALQIKADLMGTPFQPDTQDYTFS